ncbi:hypothetical protein V8C37DRAFT_395992 [Trichoderma ceciliae]
MFFNPQLRLSTSLSSIHPASISTTTSASPGGTSGSVPQQRRELAASKHPRRRSVPFPRTSSAPGTPHCTPYGTPFTSSCWIRSTRSWLRKVNPRALLRTLTPSRQLEPCFTLPSHIVPLVRAHLYLRLARLLRRLCSYFFSLSSSTSRKLCETQCPVGIVHGPFFPFPLFPICFFFLFFFFFSSNPLRIDISCMKYRLPTTPNTTDFSVLPPVFFVALLCRVITYITTNLLRYRL